MGRHSSRLSPGQRIARAALGAATVLMLAAAVWMMGRGGAAGESQLASATTVTSSSSPTSTLPTTTETPATTTSSMPTTLAATVPTTSFPTTTIETSTTTTLSPLILRSDGLGAVDLGDDTETVIAAVAERLEGSSGDSGWVAARGQFGTCPGTVVRVVRWDSLRLFFSDGPTELAEGVRHHLFYYSQSTVGADHLLDLATPEGIELGSTVEDLQEAYGDQLTIQSTISFGVNFVVDRPGQGLLSGNLTSSSPDGTVTAIAGGFGCGS